MAQANATRIRLTAERLRDRFHYDPETGAFTWRLSLRSRGRPSARDGRKAGSLKKDGYVGISFDGVPYKAHRLAWLYVYGEWPPTEIDHRDGCRSNNAIANLRLADASANAANRRRNTLNSSGFKGVTFHRKSGKWRATLQARGVSYSLGLHPTPELAHDAYVDAARRLHGEFARVA